MLVTDLIQATSEFPAYFPLNMSHNSSDRRPERRLHRLPPEVWPENSKRVISESLRQLAAEYGVSHEAIRRIVRTGAASVACQGTR
jgi:hypothetical protein